MLKLAFKVQFVFVLIFPCFGLSLCACSASSSNPASSCTGASCDAKSSNDAGAALTNPSATDASTGGSCGGVDCQGGPCVASVCQPFTVASVTTQARHLAVTADHIYVNATGRIISMALDGSNEQSITATGSGSPAWITTEGTDLFWSESVTGLGDNQDNIQEASNGGSAQLIVTGQNQIEDVAVGGTTIYWVGQNVQTATEKEGYVRSASLSGSFPATPTSLITGEESVFGIAVTSASIYYTTWTSGGAVKRAGLDGSNPTVVVSNLNFPSAIEVDDTYVYWLEASGGVDSSGLKRAPVAGGVATLVNGASIVDFALTATSIYWLQSDGAIMKVVKPS